MGGKKKRIPAGEALFRKTVVSALNGDKAAIAMALREWAKLEEQLARDQEPSYAFTEADRQTIIEIYDRMKSAKPVPA